MADPTPHTSTLAQQPQYRVLLQKEQLVFSAAHFITFAGDICERLHGHNYGVKAEVAGPLDENEYVIDFIAFRDALAEVVSQLDHRMLLPAKHSMIQVDVRDAEVTTTFQCDGQPTKRWIFPEEDCIILPIANTTAEKLAWWIAQEVKKRLSGKVSDVDTLEVFVDENHGQWGSCKVAW